MTLTRQEALAVLAAGQAELDAQFDRLTDVEIGGPGTLGGGDWAPKDLMGHIALWEELALQTVDAWRAGVAPAAAEKDTDELNAENQAAHATASVSALRARAASAHAAVLAVVNSLSDADWNAPLSWPNAEQVSLGERLGSVLAAPGRPFGHAYAHLDDLRAFCRGR
jgi:hypothetical protein